MSFIKKYLTEVIQELKKVSWPDKKQTINKTVLVIVVSLAVAAYIGGIDFVLRAMMEALIR